MISCLYLLLYCLFFTQEPKCKSDHILSVICISIKPRVEIKAQQHSPKGPTWSYSCLSLASSPAILLNLVSVMVTLLLSVRLLSSFLFQGHTCFFLKCSFSIHLPGSLSSFRSPFIWHFLIEALLATLSKIHTCSANPDSLSLLYFLNKICHCFKSYYCLLSFSRKQGSWD